jgi:crotonobetainyl-CoA hydratase/dehydration protein DpgD
MTAARACKLGLVNDVVPPDRLDAAVVEWIADILACAPLAIAAIRESVAVGLGLPLREAMAATYPAEERRKTSDDAREGPRAFAEKRAPCWTGH